MFWSGTSGVWKLGRLTDEKEPGLRGPCAESPVNFKGGPNKYIGRNNGQHHVQVYILHIYIYVCVCICIESILCPVRAK